MINKNDIAGDLQVIITYLNEIKKIPDLFEGLNDFPERIIYYGPVSGIKKLIY